ncbi:MAG: hypothetical protein WCD70_05675 [Alphaproteobacteria bacterium]
MNAQKTDDRYDFMKKADARLRDMGFKPNGVFWPVLYGYDRRVDGKRVEMAEITVADRTTVPGPESLVVFTSCADAVCARESQMAGDLVKGLGPKPVTHVLRKIFAVLGKTTNG